MKRYSNAKAKRLASNNKPSAEIDEETEIETLLERRRVEAPDSGTQLQRLVSVRVVYLC